MNPVVRSQESLQAWKFLLRPEAEELRIAACECTAGDAAAITQLRRRWSQAEVAAALELTQARRRAIGRFDNPESLVADRIGLEQATGSLVAAYKASRFARFPRVWDLCCGIGGDAMAMAARTETIAMDADPLKTWMTSRNARCEVRCEDILHSTRSTGLPMDAIHIDPSRRDAASGGRRHDPSCWTPTLDELRPLLEAHPDAAIKLAPGIDPAQLGSFDAGEGSVPGPRELEFISTAQGLTQAIWWRGQLATDAHRATRLAQVGGIASHITLSAGEPQPPPCQTPNWEDAWLHVADPAVERAHLLGLLCDEFSLAEPAPGLGLLAGRNEAKSPWLVPYQVVAHMPWRPRHIAAWLRQHDGGLVEIRTRGRAIESIDQLRSRLRGKGQTPWTIFGLRLGRSIIALITRPRGAGSSVVQSSS